MNKKNLLPGMHPVSNALAGKFWIVMALVVVVVVFFASFQWIIENPFAANMDEAVYINQAHNDVTVLQERGFRGLGRTIAYGDRAKPPLYRMLVLPVTAVWDDFPISLLRVFSLVFLVISLVFLYLAARQIAGPTAGAFAVIFLALSPVVIGANKSFGTEYPLILSIVAMFYFLFRAWDREDENPQNWIGLGFALGIGALSKMTFAAIAGPVLFVALFFSIRKMIAGPGLKFFIKAMTLGSLIAAPWWLLNYRQALEYAIFASGATSSRHALSQSLWEKLTGVPVLYTHQAIGPALTVLLVVVLLSVLYYRFSKSHVSLSRKQVTALWVCLAGILPLLIIHMTGNNQNMRYIIVPMIPFVLGLGVFAAHTQWTRKPFLILLATFLFGYQLFQIGMSHRMNPDQAQVIAEERGFFGSGPAEIMGSSDHTQWNWEPLKAIARSHNIENPSIAHLGNGTAFTSQHMQYPWVRLGERVRARWLWRYEDGDIKWDQIDEKIKDRDLVLTAPGYKGNPLDNQHLDNQNNSEFARRLRQDPGFLDPIVLFLGRSDPVEILVFVRKRTGHVDGENL